ncbi:hypothetical protein N7517_001571 [Penicillium concentricum]|uniref:Uncharacterized protein n=1 Tax=Penicillium concentricum TaxID=293559 RepID=A0A9W9SSA2_9EURO|nr:uncharacterized protein N7517_001571 [Penicillium concentricum]KAJ5383660.1 hypothetical protein N7517_001571 [Penicillium concentricum]
MQGAGEESGSSLIGVPRPCNAPPRLTLSVVGHECYYEWVGWRVEGGKDSCLSIPREEAGDVWSGPSTACVVCCVTPAGSSYELPAVLSIFLSVLSVFVLTPLAR